MSTGRPVLLHPPCGCGGCSGGGLQLAAGRRLLGSQHVVEDEVDEVGVAPVARVRGQGLQVGAAQARLSQHVVPAVLQICGAGQRDC